MDQEPIDDVGEVRDYLQTIYKSATESTWSSFILDKSQSVVFATTLAVIINYLWLVSLFGMWTWSAGEVFSTGTTMFCSSFSYTNVRLCHILPGEPLTCPPYFQSPTCISWYAAELPTSTGIATAMQVTSLTGTLVGVLGNGVSFHVLLKVADQVRFRLYMRIGTGLMAVNALCSLATFVLFLNYQYITDILNGQSCILIIEEGTTRCVPTADLEKPLASGYGFTATVVVFVFSLLNCACFAMGSLHSRLYEKEE